MNRPSSRTDGKARHRVLALLLATIPLLTAAAQPVIVSTAPPNGANNVPVSTVVTIAFSEAMNSSTTLAYLYDSTTIELLPVSLSWNAANTVLTCTPGALLPAGRTIWWTVMNGQNLQGAPLTGYTGGTFVTASSSQLALTNAIWSNGVFTFDVQSPTSQTFTVEYSSTLRSNQWQTLVTTNSSTGSVHIVDPLSTTNRFLFYRARSGA